MWPGSYPSRLEVGLLFKIREPSYKPHTHQILLALVSQSRARSISSPHHPLFKRWGRLLNSRGITQFHQFFLFGEKVIREILSRHSNQCDELITYTGSNFSLQIPPKVSCYRVAKTLFDKLDVFGTRFPLLVCQVREIPVLELHHPPQGFEVLCPLGDPTNVGALIRTCRGFGVDKLVLLQEAAHPFHPKSTRAASGAIFDQPLYRGPSLEALTNGKIARSIMALDVEGKDLSQFSWPLNVRLLVGEEGPGQPHYPFGKRLSIPMAQKANSLNATVAASIALYAYRLQHPFSRIS